MAKHTAKGTFSIKSWDEKPFAEAADAPKLTTAHVVNTYSGDLDGEGTVHHVMFYASDAQATYSGYERVVGRLAGRSGSFVLQSSGTFENGVATKWSVVPGSGTGDLKDLRGQGGYAATHQPAVDYELEYEVD
jgi:Protein of unknown function (DUF3224)